MSDTSGTDNNDQPKTPKAKVVSIFEKETVEDPEYEPTDADYLGFLRVLAYFQEQSTIMKADIRMDMDEITLLLYNEDTTDDSVDEDIVRSHVFTYKTVIDMYLPLIYAILPPNEHTDVVDTMTATMELAIESLTLDMPDDDEDEG